MDLRKVIIMTDLDGTLLTDDKRIDERDKAAIDAFRADGGIFTVATGRGVAMAKSIIDELRIDFPCVIFNGAAVYDFAQDRFLWHSDMPGCAKSYIERLAQLFPGIGVEILHEKSIYVTHNNKTVEEHLALESLTPTYISMDEFPEDGIFKILIACPEDLLRQIMEFTKVECCEQVNWVHSSPLYYEMLPSGVSKGSGYMKLLELTKAKERFTVAAGDYGNDRDMVALADLGVAVGNALGCVKEAAKLIVRDNNSAPMSEIIEYVRNL